MFKAGDRVICISSSKNLTNHKLYTIIDIDIDVDNEYLYVKNDKGFIIGYYSNRFVSLREYRKLKLEKLCLK